MPSPLTAFIHGLPKAELHLHIEGSFEPELMFAIAGRNRVRLAYDSVEALRAAYAFSNLQDFLDLYYQGMSVLHEQRDFHDLTMAYCERAHADGVRHAEIFFDPQGHTERGVPFATVLQGISSALAEARARLGLSSALIMCFLRHLPESSAEAALDMALDFREHIIGVGLDSSEQGFPPENFERVFARAAREGFRRVAHAGEEGPPAYVAGALDALGVERIDHGNRALEDPALTQRIAAAGIALTVCPLSNLRLRVVDDLGRHPLKRMLAAGLKATVNSDDPAYFGGYVNANFDAVAAALSLSRDQIVQLARNSFDAAFVDAAQKRHWQDDVTAYVQAHPPG